MAIRIDTGQVSTTGGQFNTKSAELDALIGQARSLMNSLEGQFTGTRATRIFSEWQGMQGGLTAAVQSLQQAGQLLQRAAAAFGEADSGL